MVITAAGRDEVAEAAIAALGYTVDFLRYRKVLRDLRVKVNGRRICDGGPASIVRRPLFPRYGFVRVEYGVDASDIDKAMGVVKLIRHSPKDRLIGRPQRIRAGIVESLRAAIDTGEFDDAVLKPKPKVRGDLAPGDRVHLRSTGLIGTLLRLDADGRGEYMTDLLGGATGRLSREDVAALERIGAA